MNFAPLIFLGLFATFVASWWGLIFKPQMQIGRQPVSTVDGISYPPGRAGLAEQGREVYVANGCVQCHSQQVQQDGYTFDVVLTSLGTNAAAAAKVLSNIAPGANATELANASSQAPQVILKAVRHDVATAAQSALKKTGAAAQMIFVPLGPDMARAWGPRRTVAADYLKDYPVQVGNSRLGPDLSNIGARMPDANWQLLHLYDPRTVVNGSIMPAYRYLFETRPIGRQPSSDALKLTGKFAPKAGFEVVPKPEALLLAAYLQSQRVEMALYEAPSSVLAPPPVAGTNAPPGTNAPAATNTPSK